MTNTTSKYFASAKVLARDSFERYYCLERPNNQHGIAGMSCFGNRDKAFEIWYDLYINGINALGNWSN